MIDTEMDILFYFVVLQDRDSKAYGRIFLFPLAGLLIDSKHALSGAGAKWRIWMAEKRMDTKKN
jgi:hypothetical protein